MKGNNGLSRESNANARPDKQVIIKQYNLDDQRGAFAIEVEVLQKIKRLNIRYNGGFPYLLSVKEHQNKGEMLMNFVGQDIEKALRLEADEFLNPNFNKLEWERTYKLSIDLISQLELLSKLGYIHRDIKTANICYDPVTDRYTLIDFGLASRIFNSSKELIPQERVIHQEGNCVFASDTYFKFLTQGRNDDLESLFYVLCYLFTGSLPTL